jgi:RND family efflux transporter MFP subunit
MRPIVLGCALALLVACSKGDPASAGGGGAATGSAGAGGGGGAGPKGARGSKLEYPVQVAPLALRQVRYTVAAPGSIDAFQQVQITARVAGAVDKVSFTEGQVVKQGQVLVTIESDRYQVALGQAQAALSKAQATEAQAEDELTRRQAAAQKNPGLITGEDISTHITAVATAKADVAAAQQAVRVAQLNLRDSFVRAPIAGVVQTRTVNQGQYLQAGAVLATILQREPLLLRFQVTEQEAPRLKPDMPATLRMRESTREWTAKITLVAGAADTQTRLVPVTATIDPTEHQYWLRPGAFCEVIVPIGETRQGIVIPTMSVQPTENGNIAYVVVNNVAHARPIELGMHTPEGGVEITRGLNPGDQLVVRGIEPLSDGAPVKVTEHTTVEAVESHDAGAAPEGPGADSSGAPPAHSHGGGGGDGGGGGQHGGPKP